MNYIIETPRLGLRPICQEDFADWYAMLSDPETMSYYPAPFDAAKTQSWIDWTLENYRVYGVGLWAVVLKETGAFIGDCGITMQNIYGDGRLFPEVGFHIDKRYWRKGYAGEAAAAVLKHAFRKMPSDEIFCYQKWTNTASRKTAEKIGMRLISERPDPKNEITSIYSITRDEYSAKFGE